MILIYHKSRSCCQTWKKQNKTLKHIARLQKELNIPFSRVIKETKVSSIPPVQTLFKTERSFGNANDKIIVFFKELRYQSHTPPEILNKSSAYGPELFRSCRKKYDSSIPRTGMSGRMRHNIHGKWLPIFLGGNMMLKMKVHLDFTLTQRLMRILEMTCKRSLTLPRELCFPKIPDNGS